MRANSQASAASVKGEPRSVVFVQSRSKNEPNQGRERPVPVDFAFDDKLLGTSRPHPAFESALVFVDDQPGVLFLSQWWSC